MDNPKIKIDYRNMSDARVIEEIVLLAQAGYERSLSDFCKLTTAFVEDCNVAKKKQTLELLLSEMLKIEVNHARLSSILRIMASSRNALSNWYTSRDATLSILEREEPERVKKLMAGLLDPDPQIREEMDGLDAWSSLLKQARNYA